MLEFGIHMVVIWDTDDWNPEFIGLEFGIQYLCGFCYMGWSDFAVNVPMQCNELFSVSCQRVTDKQHLLIEQSAIRREGYFYSSMQ